MGKQSGLGDALFLHGGDYSGDIGALGKIGGGPAALDVTAIDKSAAERIGGLRDGGIDYTAYFNPDLVTGVHAKLAALPTADQIVTYSRGKALGAAAACLVAKQLSYDPKRAADGGLTFDVSAAANGVGLEWGTLLTPGIRTDATGTNGAGVDMGPGSAPGFTGPANFGLQAYLHVFGLTGTSVTVKLQESSDNGVGDAWADVVGGAFTAATATGAQRIQTARNQTVKRWLRVLSTGVFTNAQFAVVVARNDVATDF